MRALPNNPTATQPGLTYSSLESDRTQWYPKPRREIYGVMVQDRSLLHIINS